jgi:hypothetical protein
MNTDEEQPMMTEEAKDRVAEFVHELVDRYMRGDPKLWRGGRPEEKLDEEFGGLSLEERRFATEFLDRLIADEDEQAPAPVLPRIDAEAA